MRKKQALGLVKKTLGTRNQLDKMRAVRRGGSCVIEGCVDRRWPFPSRERVVLARASTWAKAVVRACRGARYRPPSRLILPPTRKVAPVRLNADGSMSVGD